MKRLLLCVFIAFALTLAAAPQPSLMGKAEADVLALKGSPLSKTVAGNQVIYTWLDTVVAFEKGRARKVDVRVPTSAEKWRAQQEAKKKHDKEINDKYLADSNAQKTQADMLEEQKKDEAAIAEWRRKSQEADRLRALNESQNNLQSYTDAKAREAKEKNRTIGK